MPGRSPSILVGVDFSPSSWAATELAAALAKQAGAELVLCHCVNLATALPTEVGADLAPAWADRLRAAASERLESWSADVSKRAPSCSHRLEDGAASTVLVSLAEELHPMLTVVGRRGHARLAHVLLGSVSERVVNRSNVPVLVVPADSVVDSLPTRLLVGIDFSDGSREALTAARSWASRIGGGCEVLAAHCEPGDQDLFLLSGSDSNARWPHDQTDLERWIAAAPGDAPVEAQLGKGRAERVLLELASARSCGWIVMGLQGRTALASFLIGSTTDRVLRLTDRPVLVVPSQEYAPGEPS